jgi:hypothetical protein
LSRRRTEWPTLVSHLSSFPTEWRSLVGRNSIELTKIEIAEVQLRAALQMFFEGVHPVPVYTLANAAREIVGSIANKTGVPTASGELADVWDIKEKDVLRPLVLQANFFKHADRDADAKLVFDEDHVRYMLTLAYRDFLVVTNALPVEARVFKMWYAALVPKVTEWPLGVQRHIRNCIRFFPGIRRAADLAEQKKIGLAVLNITAADLDL